MQTAKDITQIGAALAVLIFFGAATWVILPYRDVPVQLAAAAKVYTDAAPQPGRIDSAIAAIEASLPAPGSLQNVTDSVARTIQSMQTIGPAATSAIDQTATQLTRKCSGPDGPDTCGTLAQANKTMIKAGDAIVTTQIEELKIFPHTTAAMDALKGDADQLNVALKDQAIHQAAANLAAMEDTGNGILLDVKKETDSLVAPKTRTQKVMGWLPTGLKLGAMGACLATGTTCP